MLSPSSSSASSKSFRLLTITENVTTNAAQGRSWQALLWFEKFPLAKDAKFIRVLWEFGAFIVIVNSMLPEKWFSAASCLYWVGSKSSVNPAYT